LVAVFIFSSPPAAARSTPSAANSANFTPFEKGAGDFKINPLEKSPSIPLF
jgi:hypothetical protein